jgi:hypothetical protein
MHALLSIRINLISIVVLRTGVFLARFGISMRASGSGFGDWKRSIMTG